MKRWVWRVVYAGIFYLGFVAALNTTWELQARRAEPECATGCCW